MSLWINLSALFISYLLGSISFARIVTGLVSPDTDIRGAEAPIENSERTLRMSSISATSVRITLGARYGCLVSVLDMLKVAVPVAFFEFVLAAHQAAYLAALGGLIGHNWPLFYRFEGGYGHSPIYGAMLVLNWVAVPVNFFGTAILYGILRQVHLALFGGVALLVPLLWYQERAFLPVAYAVLASGAYFLKILPDFQTMRSIQMDAREEQAESPDA